jgi:hypothetical protein
MSTSPLNGASMYVVLGRADLGAIRLPGAPDWI